MKTTLRVKKYLITFHYLIVTYKMLKLFMYIYKYNHDVNVTNECHQYANHIIL